MKVKTAKQEKRLERKKQKSAALANLVFLNEKDRRSTALKQSMSSSEHSSPSSPSSNEDEAGFQLVTNKNQRKSGKRKILEAEETTSEAKRTKSEENASSTEMNNDSECNKMDLNGLKVQLSYAQCKEVCRKLKERKRALEEVPVLHLREFGQRALLSVPNDCRTPIFLTDLQHLLMSTLIGHNSPCTPERWCFIEKCARLSHSVVLVVEGAGLYHYLSNETSFERTKQIFTTSLEMMMPPCKRGTIIEEMAQIPLTNAQAHELIEQHGSLEIAIEMNKDPTLFVKEIFPIEPTLSSGNTGGGDGDGLASGDKFPRTKLLLSALQMVDEGYPMPLRGELQARFKDYVFTKKKYAPVTDRSPMFGVDCEMCRTDKQRNELTRISMVNEAYEIVYETLVLPSSRIVDYLTPYSGITAEMLKTVTKTLADVQREVQELLPPDAILVGQSLNSDLNAMKMMHPYVIDTSVCFNITGQRRRKSKLQTLAMRFLKEAIQENADGHDSVEDSLATLKLVKMKLANSLEYGDEILLERKRFFEIQRLTKGTTVSNNLFAHATQRDKRTAIVTAGALQERAKEILKRARADVKQDSMKAITVHEMESNKKVVQKALDVALEHHLTIANVQLYEENLHLNVVGKTCRKLDKWINKLWQSVAHNGLFVVVMGGTVDAPSGVAKIAIKKNLAEAAVAITV